jgi:hypothetical protein
MTFHAAKRIPQPAQQFFVDRSLDALMGSMLSLTTELLQLSVRQRRLEAAVRDGHPVPPDDDTGLSPQERAWVRARADALVAAWLDPFGA